MTLFTKIWKDRVPSIVQRGDYPYTELVDIPLFPVWDEGKGEFVEYEPSGIERRYAAGMHALIQSSATVVELSPRGIATDGQLEDWSRFLEVYVHTGPAHYSPDGDGKRNAHGGRDVELWCGLEVHITVGGKYEWGLYGPMEVCVSSRTEDALTNFWVEDPEDSTLRAIGSVVIRHLFGQLMTAQMDDDEGES